MNLQQYKTIASDGQIEGYERVGLISDPEETDWHLCYFEKDSKKFFEVNFTATDVIKQPVELDKNGLTLAFYAYGQLTNYLSCEIMHLGQQKYKDFSNQENKVRLMNYRDETIRNIIDEFYQKLQEEYSNGGDSEIIYLLRTVYAKKLKPYKIKGQIVLSES